MYYEINLIYHACFSKIANGHIHVMYWQYIVCMFVHGFMLVISIL